MKALVVSPFYPLPIRSGGHARIANLVKYMGRRHQIDMLSLSTPEHGRESPDLEGLARPAELIPCRQNHTLAARLGEAVSPANWARTFCRAVDRLVLRLPHEASRYYQPEFVRRLKSLAGERRYDVIQFEFTAMGGRFAPMVKALAPRSALVVEEIDIAYVYLDRLMREEKDPGRKRYLRAEMNRMIPFEKHLWNEVDAIVTMSDTDRDHIAGQVQPEKVWTVPNGVDTEHFAFRPRVPNPDQRLLFVGYYQHPPNLQALEYFLGEIYPHLRRRYPRLGLDIVGDAAPAAIRSRDGKDGIRVHGYVPDIRPLMAEAAALAASIRSGGGTRLKMLEAFAAGLPIVATSLALEGIDVTPGEHVFVGDTAQEYLGAACRALDDPAGAAGIAANARKRVERLYGWQVICQQLERAWQFARGSACAHA